MTLTVYKGQTVGPTTGIVGNLIGGSVVLPRIRRAADAAKTGKAVTFQVESGDPSRITALCGGTRREILAGNHQVLVRLLPAVQALFRGMVAGW